MLNTKAILLEAEDELVQQKDSVKRAVKLGILCTILQATVETYRGVNAEGSASALATQILDVILKSGAFRELLHEPMCIEKDEMVAKEQPEQHVSGRINSESLEEMAQKIFTTLGLNEDERTSLTQTLKDKLGPEEFGEVLSRSPAEIAEDELLEVQRQMGMGMPAGFGPPPPGFHEDGGVLNASTI